MLRKTLGRHHLPITTAKSSPDHQRLMVLINNMSEGVIAIDQKGLVQFSNGVALNLFDTNLLTGKRIAEFMNLVDVRGKKFDVDRILEAGKAFNSRDLIFQYQDGSSINIEINCSPVRLGFGSKDGGFVIIVKDITQSRSLEEERDEFISVASHELRTPVAIAEGNLSNVLLLADQTKTNATLIGSLKAAHDQVLFLAALINDLSMLSRAQRKDTKVEVSTISAKELCSNLVDSVSEKVKEKNLKITSSVKPTNLEFNSNELYVREIMQNFLTNSLKYTEKGGVSIDISGNANGITLRVSDTGIGISKSEQKKLFSKFFRSKDARVQRYSGTGLGLYVSSKLAKLINGQILVKSTLNKGSEFCLVIPRSI